jgi:hypothetical protein
MQEFQIYTNIMPNLGKPTPLLVENIVSVDEMDKEEVDMTRVVKGTLALLSLMLLLSLPSACTKPDTNGAMGTEGTSTLVGTVEDISATTWTIDDKVVQVGDDVLIKGNILIGDRVEALVILGENASLHAIEIEFVSRGTSVDPNETNHLDDKITEVVEFNGIVESISSESWTISEKKVTITSQTVIKGNNHLGKTVWIQAQPQEDGSYIAIQIKPMD